MKAALLALGITLWAPYQCATEPDERPQEDSAPKALYVLAEKFEQEGNGAARETTLHQLIEQYPASRYAERARSDLGMASGRGQKHTGSEATEESKRDAPKDDEQPSAAEAGEE
jgi:outer membrane protein assembly factor BamD (BamD/ComL family)